MHSERRATTGSTPASYLIGNNGNPLTTFGFLFTAS